MADKDNDAPRHYATGGIVDPDDALINLYPRSEELHRLLAQRMLDAPRQFMLSTPNQRPSQFERLVTEPVMGNGGTMQLRTMINLDYSQIESRVLSQIPDAERAWLQDPISDLRKKELRGQLATTLARIRDRKQGEIESKQDWLLRLTADLPDAWL